MTQQALTTVNGTAIQAYGEREQVREIVDRLMSLHPAARDVGQQGMRAVAQLAVMVGANPLPGANEIYVWKQRNGAPQIDLGVAYYRRKAAEKDTVMWIDGMEPRPMTDGERARYNIPADALAGICKGFILSKYLVLLDKGVPWDAAQKMLARTSTAIVAHGEMYRTRDTQYSKKGDPIDPPTGRTWQWVAEKRAEKGFYRTLSLVDTTLTDAMQEHTQGVLDQLRGKRQLSPEAESVAGELQKMELDDFNEMFFDAGPETAVSDDIQDAEYIEVDETAVVQAAAISEQESRIADIRATLKEADKPTVGLVCDYAVQTGLYKSAHHALNAQKGFAFPDNFRLEFEQRVTNEGAVKIFDWLVDRKLDREEE